MKTRKLFFENEECAIYFYTDQHGRFVKEDKITGERYEVSNSDIVEIMNPKK